MFVQLDETVNWPSVTFEYGPFPRPGLDYDLFGFELGRFGRISADGRALTLPPEYIHIDQVHVFCFFIVVYLSLISVIVSHCLAIIWFLPHYKFLTSILFGGLHGLKKTQNCSLIHPPGFWHVINSLLVYCSGPLLLVKFRSSFNAFRLW